MVLIDGTMDLLDASLVIVFGGLIFAVITYPLNHVLRIILYRFRTKELVMKSFFKNIFMGLLSFLIIWPIFIFIIEAILTIGYLLLGLSLFIITDLDITSEGTLGAEIFENILFPNGKISFWPLLPWRYFWITFFISIILAGLNKDKSFQKGQSSSLKKRERKEISCICDYCLKTFVRQKNSKIPLFYVNNIPYSYHQDCYENVLVNEKEIIEKKPSTFFAKPKEYKSKTKSSKLEEQHSFDKKQDEIEEFFEALQRKKKSIGHYTLGAILNDANYNIFYSFINETNKSLDILCWRIDERLMSEMLWFIKDKNVDVKIITKNRRNKGYLTEFKKYCSNLKLETIHRNKIHAKLIIKDNIGLILGSSNFTEASMSESGHLLDCNIITKHRQTIESAIDLFKSLVENKDYTKEIQNSKLMYSRNHKSYLPFSIKSYFEKESEEITLLFSCNQVDKRIIDRIIEWNPKTTIKLYVSDTWATSELSIDNVKSMKWLYEASIKNYKNVNVTPVTADIHSKLYLFKNQKIAFISSQNLTVESWQSLLEAGVLTDDKRDLKYLYDSINLLKKSRLSKIDSEGLEEASKPESTFSGSEHERSMSVPWELPEANAKWRIPRTRNQSYYRLVKYKPKQKKEERLENVGKREGSSKITESSLLEELESKYLSKQSFTGLYSKPTRLILRGKSKKEEKQFWENELERLNKKYEIATSEEDKKGLREAIDYIEKQLEKFE